MNLANYKFLVRNWKYIEVDEADSCDSQDHVSVDSSHDAEEGEDIVI